MRVRSPRFQAPGAQSRTQARAGPEAGAWNFCRKLGSGIFVVLAAGCIWPAEGLGQKLFIERGDFPAAEVERMYLRGLQFLARTQRPDGTWPDPSYGSYPAVVGLAVLSFLAHGDDPNYGPFKTPIQRGLDRILKAQNAATGYIGDSMYNHGFATLAFAEAYGEVKDSRLGPALEKAVTLIVEAQKKNPQGGWRYSPESTDADTTVSGAQMVALFAARNAGIAVPEEAVQKGLRFFISRQVPNSGFGYTMPSDPNAARTAIGCLVLALAKEKDTGNFQSAFEFLKKAPPDPGHPQYYLYYAAQAFFHGSASDWQAWNVKNIKTLSVSQGADGSWEGSYGATFGTATSLLSLALNYRYLPIYER